jgi:hypothetical protein
MSDEQVELTPAPTLTQKMKAFLLSTGAAQTPGPELSGHEETHFCALVEYHTGTPAYIVRDNAQIIEGFINSGIGAAKPVEAPAVDAVTEAEEPKAAVVEPQPEAPKAAEPDPIVEVVVDTVVDAVDDVPAAEGAPE